jgi:hypothetical protein
VSGHCPIKADPENPLATIFTSHAYRKEPFHEFSEPDSRELFTKNLVTTSSESADKDDMLLIFAKLPLLPKARFVVSIVVEWATD